MNIESTRTWTACAIGVALAFTACVDSDAPTVPAGPAHAVLPGAVVPGSVAFISGRTGRTEVFVMNRGGDQETQLTFSDVDEVLDNLRIEWITNRPVWSPDGRKLLFTRRAWDLSVTPNALIHDIHILDLDDPTPRPRRLINNPGPSGTPTWSPDGQKVAYCSFNAGPATIYIYDLTTDAFTSTGALGCWPDWSPDGSTIAFHTSTTPGAQLALLDVSTFSVTYLTSHTAGNLANDFFPRWSPDGQWLAFQSNRDKDVNGARYGSIFVVPADGSAAPSNVTPVPTGQAATGWTSQQPAWAHNSKQLYFNGTRPGLSTTAQVFRTDLAGTDVVMLTESGGGNIQPNARPITRP